MKRIVNVIRNAPFYTKNSSDRKMWASVYNSEDIKLFVYQEMDGVFEIEPDEMTIDQIEFCEQARREALKEMCEY